MFKIAVPGYQRLRVGPRTALALNKCADAVRDAITSGTLHELAAAHPEARILSGRGPAYAIPLGGCGRVVVRHARRGGLAARVNHDVFFSPLRPLREVITALRLRLTGVPTPEIVAYVTYPAMLGYRYDVAVRELEGGADLAAWLARERNPDVRERLIDTTVSLLRSLVDAGAHHPDLNAKNVLLVRVGEVFSPYVIDLDPVRFHPGGAPMVKAANLERLVRSLRKLAAAGLTITEGEISTLERRALAPAQPEPPA